MLRFGKLMNPESNNKVQDAPSGPRLRMAYLLSDYPAVSHTFFLNEIVALRQLGFTIDVASINRPVWPPGVASARETNAVETTFYVKATGPMRILLTLLRIVFTNPRVLARGLRTAFQLDGWNLPASGYALFYLGEALLLGDWLRKRDHSHLHIHFGGPVATVGMLASVAWRFSYSLTIHGPEEFYDVQKFHLGRKVALAAFVLCISDYCRSQVMKVCDPIHWPKLRVVRLGVDLEVFAPVPRAERGGPTEIICIGRFVPAKGHLVLLHAFSGLLRRGYNLRLRLIGEGTERRTLESFVAHEKLVDSVIFEGALSHESTRQKLAQADIFVLSSFAEGLPVALMEAMAMEIPCISTFVAGIPELVRDGIDGLLVPASSEDGLYIALERLISNADLRQMLARAGRIRIQEFYDLKKNARLLSDTLQNWLSTVG